MSTRERILEAARALVEDEGAAVPMERIAARADLSRRAVYDHFPSRTELLVALVSYVDEQGELEERSRSIWESSTALEAMDGFVALNAVYTPQIDAIARALQRARDIDAGAAAAWDDRMESRRRACLRIAKWLEDDGVLADGISIRTATDLLWALTNIPFWRALVVDRGWSARRYTEHVRQILRSSLCSADDEARPSGYLEKK